MSSPISDPGLTGLLPMSRDLTEERADALESLADRVEGLTTVEEWSGVVGDQVAHLRAVAGILRAALSAPRISDEAVEFWAKQKFEAWEAGESTWETLGQGFKRARREKAREDLTAILPLLCGGLEEARSEATVEAEDLHDRALVAEKRAEKAEQELEQARALGAELSAAARINADKLSQVREEVEAIVSIYNDDSLSNSAAQDRTEEVARKILAILDSSSSLSGDGGSSGVKPVPADEMLGILKGYEAPPELVDDPQRVIIEFLDSWRFCPVSEASTPARSCLENAAGQLLAALTANSGDVKERGEEEVYAAAVALTETLNPHLGGEARADEISALCQTGMPEALEAARKVGDAERGHWRISNSDEKLTTYIATSRTAAIVNTTDRLLAFFKDEGETCTYGEVGDEAAEMVDDAQRKPHVELEQDGVCITYFTASTQQSSTTSNSLSREPVEREIKRCRRRAAALEDLRDDESKDRAEREQAEGARAALVETASSLEVLLAEDTIRTEPHLSPEDTVTCEACGRKLPRDEARQDPVSEGWFCPPKSRFDSECEPHLSGDGERLEFERKKVDVVEETAERLASRLSSEGKGYCDQCEQPKAGTVALGPEGEEELCAPCLLVRLLAVLKPAEGHDFKLADRCPTCGASVPDSSEDCSGVEEGQAYSRIEGVEEPEVGVTISLDPDCIHGENIGEFHPKAISAATAMLEQMLTKGSRDHRDAGIIAACTVAVSLHALIGEGDQEARS